MKLTKRKMTLISFMLFSLFFGAGNLIFPPFLGQNAGDHLVSAMVGFLATAVIFPGFGVIVVAEFDGLDRLAQNVGKHFSLIFTVLIYLSIGPGLGIPRAASVPFEMAVAPYLPEGQSVKLWMAVYSLVFFLIALWLCMTPGKLVNRIGHVLTPSLLILIVFLFISFLFKGEVNIAPAQEVYQKGAFFKGFSEGYQTMDTIAALNFGLVIATTLGTFGLKEKKDLVRRYNRRLDSCRCLHNALLHGRGKLRRLSYSGERSMDASLYRISAFRRTGCDSPRRYFYTCVPYNLRRPHQFHFAVFLGNFQKDKLSQMGLHHNRFFFLGLQPRSDGNSQHFDSDS